MCTPCIVSFTCDLQIAQLRTMIETDQQMLIQFAEEKMALACQCFDLVDMHLMQIDRDIDTFDAEIQVVCAVLQRQNCVPQIVLWQPKALNCKCAHMHSVPLGKHALHCEQQHDINHAAPAAGPGCDGCSGGRYTGIPSGANPQQAPEGGGIGP